MLDFISISIILSIHPPYVCTFLSPELRLTPLTITDSHYSLVYGINDG